MKKFFVIMAALKERIALCYTGAMCYYLFFLFLFRQQTADWSILFSLLLISIVAGSMQLVAFSSLVIKKLGYGWRMAVFALPFFAVMAGVAVKFRWFPTERADAWVSFVLIFLAIFLFISVGFEIYYRITGRRYDDRLEWYRKNR